MHWNQEKGHKMWPKTIIIDTSVLGKTKLQVLTLGWRVDRLEGGQAGGWLVWRVVRLEGGQAGEWPLATFMPGAVIGFNTMPYHTKNVRTSLKEQQNSKAEATVIFIFATLEILFQKL